MLSDTQILVTKTQNAVLIELWLSLRTYLCLAMRRIATSIYNASRAVDKPPCYGTEPLDAFICRHGVICEVHGLLKIRGEANKSDLVAPLHLAHVDRKIPWIGNDGVKASGTKRCEPF